MKNSDTDIFDSLEYVSRGGQKLAKALKFFNVSPDGKVCIDCGASTGGFTDCLLQNGARMVYAIDVGYGQLAWTLRNDLRVVTMERTNIRYVTPDMLTEKPEIAVTGVSFISLTLVVPVVYKLLTSKNETKREAVCPECNYEVISLLKPQFEAGRDKVGKKGVVRDPETHKEVLHTFMQHANDSGFYVQGLTYSPVKGPKGNIEFLGYLTTQGENKKIDINELVKEAHRM